MSNGSPLGRVAKRGLDIAGASVALIVCSPLLLLVTLLLKMGSPGPAFFRQERVGRGGRPFRIWKFRTMVLGAAENGLEVTTASDARVTDIGRRLRRWKVDELPQFLNVIGGSMSLVGPRPEVQTFVDLYTDEERAVLEYRPGITDPASLAYRNEGDILARVDEPRQYYVDVIMREKLRLNLAYARRATVFSDFGVILDTLMVAAGLGGPPATGP